MKIYNTALQAPKRRGFCAWLQKVVYDTRAKRIFEDEFEVDGLQLGCPTSAFSHSYQKVTF